MGELSQFRVKSAQLSGVWPFRHHKQELKWATCFSNQWLNLQKKPLARKIITVALWHVFSEILVLSGLILYIEHSFQQQAFTFVLPCVYVNLFVRVVGLCRGYGPSRVCSLDIMGFWGSESLSSKHPLSR